MNYNNIFKVLTADDLTQILEKNKNKIVSIFYSTNDCQNCKQIYPMFAQTSQEYPNVFFILINLDKFKDGSSNGIQYSHNITHVPHFSFYYNNKQVFEFTGGSFSKFRLSLNTLLKQIDDSMNNSHDHVSNENQSDIAIENHDENNKNITESSPNKLSEKEKKQNMIDSLKFNMLQTKLNKINNLEQIQIRKQLQMIEHLKQIKYYKEKEEYEKKNNKSNKNN